MSGFCGFFARPFIAGGFRPRLSVSTLPANRGYATGRTVWRGQAVVDAETSTQTDVLSSTRHAWPSSRRRPVRATHDVVDDRTTRHWLLRALTTHQHTHTLGFRWSTRTWPTLNWPTAGCSCSLLLFSLHGEIAVYEHVCTVSCC